MLDTVHQQWVATLDAIRDPIFVLDQEQRVVRSNEAFARLAAASFPSLVNRPIHLLLPWLSAGLEAVNDEVQSTPDGRLYRIRSSQGGNRLDGRVFILEDQTETLALESAEHRFSAASRHTLAEMLKTLSVVLDKKDPYTVEHNRNVAQVAALIAKRLGYDEAQVEGIFLGALVHDIGKLCVPSSILNRPGKLVEAEFSLIRLHPENGHSFVENLEFPWPVHQIILQHHERLDGSGYPFGIKGGAISEAARIVAVADVADAMSSDRPYRRAIGLRAALSELDSGKVSSFDPDVVDALFAVIGGDASQLPSTWAN